MVEVDSTGSSQLEHIGEIEKRLWTGADIHDFLYSDATGLPEIYTGPEIEEKTQVVFAHVYRVSATSSATALSSQ